MSRDVWERSNACRSPAGDSDTEAKELMKLSDKYLVPVGLVVAFVTIVFATSFTNSRASGTPNDPEKESPQQQMQFPEGLDYSKFLHNTQNHARLPCLLC